MRWNDQYNQASVLRDWDLLEADIMTIEKLLSAFEETGEGCGLLSDDAGHWAVSTSGVQNVPMDPPEDITTSFFVEAAEWKSTIREALQAYYDEHVLE